MITLATRPYCNASDDRTGTCTKRATRLARTSGKPIPLCDGHAAPVIDCTDPFIYEEPDVEVPEFSEWTDDWDDFL
jgi:hypothetical protein